MFILTFLSYLSIICIFCSARLFFENNIPAWTVNITSKSSGKKLFLTTLINDGDDSAARKLARVDKNLFLDAISYSGYLTVDDEFNSNLWFWFFPAEGTSHLYEDDDESDYLMDYDDANNNTIDYKNENKPLLLWLQGGPGASSLFGLFTENGPFLMNEDQISISKNPYSWNKNYSMLYIDNPVGTGFSFTNDDGYVQTVDQAGAHLYDALKQFLKMFPWLQEAPLYLTGESFAGKYIPVLATKIDEANTKHDFKMNMKGMAIGNAFIDPKNMLHYSDFALQTGLIDRHGYNEMKLFEILTIEDITQPLSKIYYDYILETFLKYSYYMNVYNVLQPTQLVSDKYLKYINQIHIRNALHVGKQEFASPIKVYYNLILDFMSSVMPLVDELLDKNYKLMLYSGNLDFIVAYPLSANTYKQMKWKGSEDHSLNYRKPFFFNRKLAGYTKKTNNFYEAIIINAGHMVPMDQPAIMMNLLNKFIDDDI